MSSPDFEQMAAAQKATADALTAVMRTSFEGMLRLADLNMAAAREAFSSNVSAIGKLTASKDMSAIGPLSQELASPERTMEYWRNVYSLVSAMQKDVTEVMQANYSQLAKTAASAMQEKRSSGAGGSDVVADLVQNMLEQGNKAFNDMTAMASQMANMVNSQIQPPATAASATKGGGKR